MAMTNTAEQIAPLGPCDGCENDVTADEVMPFRVETHSGQEFVARWCADCHQLAPQLDEDIKTIRDITDEDTSAADWSAFGWDAESSIVPVRIVTTLSSGIEVNALAAFDCDYWWVKSAHDIATGCAVELAQKDIDAIAKALNQRRASEAGE